MPTLIDTPEFAAAKDALETTLERAEQARQRRLESVRKYLQESENGLKLAKEWALQLPTDIARYRAEIARLEATTGGDILREAVGALKAECWGTPGEAMQSQPDELPRPIPGCKHIATDGTCGHPNALTPECHLEVVCPALAKKKPHACPRCDEGMREIEITSYVSWPDGMQVRTGQKLWASTVDANGVNFGAGYGLVSGYRFTRPAVPPRSKWCDGSGKGGAE